MRILSRLAGRLIAHYAARRCDLPIGGEPDPYLRRWYVLPRNRLCNVYLHCILRSDEDRALHDHPWVNCSILLRGTYFEVVSTPGATLTTLERRAGYRIRRPSRAHRLVVTAGGSPVWTLFMTGPRVRDWGFWCPRGWVHWRTFTAGAKGELVGRGCGEP